ncbi:MAG: hypothetical protein ACLTCI_08190 [[Clostridium] nexile]
MPHDFVDFLEKSGQHLWQILPLTPTGFGIRRIKVQHSQDSRC